MATVFTSNLRLALPTTGAESGTWGDTVNNSITTLVDTAIAGLASLTMTTADYTLSSANGATDEARCMFLTIGGTPGAARNIIVPALSKLYIVYNNSTGGYAQTVKTSAGTGISVPNGSRAVLYCDGTNVVTAATYASAMTLGTALPVASGGTGLSSAGTSGYVLASNGSAFVATDLAATTNVWTGTQTFTNSLLKLLGSSTGVTTFASANAGASNYTITFPAATATVATLDGTQTLTNKTIDISTNTLTGVQATLVSGTNIKTVNSNSLVGSGDVVLGAAGSIEVFTSSTTWTCPAGVTKAKVTVVGGGGSAGNGVSQTGGGGGGGGAAIKVLTVVPATVYTVTIGAGGVGLSAGVGNTTGNAGGTSSFSGGVITTVSATGGAGGPSSTAGGAGGVGSNGDLNISGGAGGAAAANSNVPPALGGSTVFAGNTPGGTAGNAYGGGSGGKYNNIGSPDGAAGVIVIEY